MVEYFKKILSGLLFITKHILSILSTLSPSIFSIFLLLVIFLIGREYWPKPKTYGQIWVDSPEIYTRERLVNDRFLQDSWLQGFLKNEKYKEKMSVSIQRLYTQIGDKKRENNNTDFKDLLENLSKISASSESRLIDELDYRDRIRNLIIENQLDDRHDLNGNSLYRLKFDTTIMPGNRTSANAWIEIKLKSIYSLGSDSLLGDLNKWRKIYKKWLHNLEIRLNQTHAELINSYTNNEFKHSDYEQFISFLEIYNDFEFENIASLGECKSKRLSNYSQDSAINHKKYKKCINDYTIYYQNKKVQSKEKYFKKHTLEEANASISELYKNKNIKVSGLYGNDNVNLQEESIKNYSVANGQQTSSREKTLNILKRNLNVFMHLNTLKLVFGIKMTAEDMREAVFSNIFDFPQLNNLSKISIFNSSMSNRNQNIYHVGEKYHTFIAQDFLTEEKRSITAPLPLGMNINSENNLTLYIKKSEAMTLEFISGSLKKSGLKIPINQFAKVEKRISGDNYVIGVESGLIRFILKALEHTKTYSYAITPKMRANNQIFSSNRIQGFDINSSLLNTPLSLGRKSNIQTRNRQGTTVGYGKAGTTHEAVFGWVIGPQLALAQSSTMVHTPQQLSLSALLAVPSWWDKGKLEVKTKWIDENGTVQDNNETIEYGIDFPLDFKQLETKILDQIHFGPELYDTDQEPIRLIACQPGTILIRGKRLWRSTMVTLGTQSADQILVLPNMKGIIAKFNNIINPISIDEEQTWNESENKDLITIKRRVRVWTSQGTISLPQQAEVGVYQECHQHRITDIINRGKGND